MRLEEVGERGDVLGVPLVDERGRDGVGAHVGQRERRTDDDRERDRLGLDAARALPRVRRGRPRVELGRAAVLPIPRLGLPPGAL